MLDYINATTDDQGYYTIPKVFGGSYKVHFSLWSEANGTEIEQWAYGKLDQESADTITVTPGATTTVNDSKLPTGSIKITAKDSLTGNPINEFWASGGFKSGETTNGAVLLSDVSIGNHKVSVGANGYKIKQDLPVTVTEGNQTTLVVELEPYSKIKTKVVDAKTGAPIAGVCVAEAQPQFARMPDGCGFPTDASGEVTVNLQKPGSYQLFAMPMEESAAGYGAQWVGATGGTGNQAAARLITVANGATVTVPPIKLDKAGVITGKVTSETGKAVKWGGGGTFPVHFNIGSSVGIAPVDSSGNYRIDFLGPYQWPLMFFAQDHATQWSGGVGNRLAAETVKVTTGATTIYNYRLKQGRAVKFKISDRSEYGFLVLHDAVSGDYVNAGWSENASTDGATVRVLSGEKIRVAWIGSRHWEWFGGSTFATAFDFVVTNMSYTISLDHPVRPTAERRRLGPTLPEGTPRAPRRI